MGDNTIGTFFKVTSFGESHGNVIGVIIDGTPAGLDFDIKVVQQELNKRKPGQSRFSTPRSEEDKVELASGVFDNKTTGAPICMWIKNEDVDSSKYEKMRKFLRPSQVDYTALKKFGGFEDYRGSGRFSGRITASLVMAGAIAKEILKKYNISVFAYTKSIGTVMDETNFSLNDLSEALELRESSPIRSINVSLIPNMEEEIDNASRDNDSIGGTIKCIVKNFPVGIGGPIFNGLESNISKIVFSVPAVKAIEFGSGFKAAEMRGSVHNDPWIIDNGKIKTSKNDAGGIIGGISTGMPIEFKVAIKPTPSIGIPQKTIDLDTMKETEFQIKGKHDPCIVPRAVVVIEAVTAIVLLDQLMFEDFIPRVLNTQQNI